MSTKYGFEGIGRLASLSHGLGSPELDVTYSPSNYTATGQLINHSCNNDIRSWTDASSTSRPHEYQVAADYSPSPNPQNPLICRTAQTPTSSTNALGSPQRAPGVPSMAMPCVMPAIR
jgi:hypothetical protein